MRTILHSDLNNCYASIECLFHPELRDVPMAVGGSPEKRHGIILAKNIPAKKYGIQTGETIGEAMRKCPKLTVLPPRMNVYSEYCRAAAEIYADYTDMVEAFGPDERWLDVTASANLFGSGRDIAEDIRRRVKKELGLTVSIGVSFNKIYAKIGSDLKKPDAITEITPQNYREKVYPLPAENLLFVGKSTLRALRSRGIYTIGEIAEAPPELLRAAFGKNGEALRRNAAGLDTSEVKRLGEGYPIKSIGNSTTPLRDMKSESDIKLIFGALSQEVASRLRAHDFKCKGIQIHVRLNDLTTAERQKKLTEPTSLSTEIFAAATELFFENFELDKPVRSVGIRTFDLTAEDEPIQLRMDKDYERLKKKERLERTADMINSRFGKNSVVPARMYCDKTLMDMEKPTDKIKVFRSH